MIAFNARLVVCLWQNHIKSGLERATLEYRDSLSEWLGNASGRCEFREHLHAAKSAGIPLRLVIAKPVTDADKKLVGQVADESAIKKEFFVRKDLIGTLEEFDGDNLYIKFRRLT